MKKYLSILSMFLMLFWMNSCNKEKSPSPYADSELMNQVGDIVSDDSLDKDFENCNIGNIPQYYAYKEKPFAQEKLHFERYIQNGYKTPENLNESGLLRIRFVVNCKGKSGRFRMLSMNENYEKMTFSKEISDQLLTLTKDYKEWRVLEHDGLKSDYFFYVIFKIKEGMIKEILP